MTTGIIYSDRYLDHDLGPSHPEKPDRLKSIVRTLEEEGLWRADDTRLIDPTPCTEEDLKLVHDFDYINSVKESSAAEIMLDLDTPTRKNTFELALLSAGGTIEAEKRVVEGRLSNSFALVRPPGHHATRGKGGGFCYFNNIAIAVKSMDLRTLILDIDCHAGNGTIDIFWEDNSVLYLSLHQWPLYPGTGWWDEIGGMSGEGFTINLPLYPSTGDDMYIHFVKTFFLPLVEQFEPEVIGVSAGFDAHRSDPLTQMNLSLNAYYQVGKFLHNHKVFAVLEGGYDLDVLPRAVLAFLAGMRDEEFVSEEEPTVTRKGIKEKNIKRLREIKKLLSQYWVL